MVTFFGTALPILPEHLISLSFLVGAVRAFVFILSLWFYCRFCACIWIVSFLVDSSFRGVALMEAKLLTLSENLRSALFLKIGL